jgi:hypothetical protein
MPAAKGYTKSQWEAFASALDALPEKPATEHSVPVREAMKELKARVRAAQAKGYTLDQIAEQAKSHGIEITAGTIRYALRAAGKGSGAGSGSARASSGVRATGAGNVASPRAPGNPSHTNQVRKDVGKSVTRQPMPVQGTLGFAIRPDTDDL